MLTDLKSVALNIVIPELLMNNHIYRHRSKISKSPFVILRMCTAWSCLDSQHLNWIVQLGYCISTCFSHRRLRICWDPTEHTELYVSLRIDQQWIAEQAMIPWFNKVHYYYIHKIAHHLNKQRLVMMICSRWWRMTFRCVIWNQRAADCAAQPKIKHHKQVIAEVEAT